MKLKRRPKPATVSMVTGNVFVLLVDPYLNGEVNPQPAMSRVSTGWWAHVEHTRDEALRAVQTLMAMHTRHDITYQYLIAEMSMPALLKWAAGGPLQETCGYVHHVTFRGDLMQGRYVRWEKIQHVNRLGLG